MATQKPQTPSVTKTAGAATTQAVKAETPITYDGEAIATGKTFDVRAADLAQLLAVNAVTIVESTAA